MGNRVVVEDIQFVVDSQVVEDNQVEVGNHVVVEDIRFVVDSQVEVGNLTGLDLNKHINRKE